TGVLNMIFYYPIRTLFLGKILYEIYVLETVQEEDQFCSQVSRSKWQKCWNFYQERARHLYLIYVSITAFSVVRSKEETGDSRR
ncbi:MAG: hypothetical protein ACK559_37210, partial [bacterium]